MVPPVDVAPTEPVTPAPPIKPPTSSAPIPPGSSLAAGAAAEQAVPMADNKTTTPQGLRVLAIVCHNPIMPDVLTLRIVVD